MNTQAQQIAEAFNQGSTPNAAQLLADILQANRQHDPSVGATDYHCQDGSVCSIEDNTAMVIDPDLSDCTVLELLTLLANEDPAAYRAHAQEYVERQDELSRDPQAAEWFADTLRSDLNT